MGRVVRMQRARRTLSGQGLVRRAFCGEVEDENVKPGKQTPDRLIVVRRAGLFQPGSDVVTSERIAALDVPGRLMRLMKLAADPSWRAQRGTSW